MRISDWSSDVCSSDLIAAEGARGRRRAQPPRPDRRNGTRHQRREPQRRYIVGQEGTPAQPAAEHPADDARIAVIAAVLSRQLHDVRSCEDIGDRRDTRSEEHTSELQSLMRSSNADFCLKKKNNTINKP